MKKSRKAIFIAVGIGILCLLLIFGGIKAYQFYTQPQAPTLSLAIGTTREVSPTATATSLSGIQPSPTSQTFTETAEPAPTKPAPTQSLAKAPTQASPSCGQTGAWTILVLGRSVHTQPGGTQVIRLLQADFDQKRMLIYSFPSILALETPGLVADYGIKYSYLEVIFPRIMQVIGEGEESDFKATQAVAQVILDNFGVPAEHYITVDDDVIMEAIDALGGIYVNLPEDFKMPENSKYKGMVLKAGLQHFDGEMLHAYVSYVGKSENEFYRLSRQNVVLEGLRKKLMDPSTLFKVIDLYSLYKEHVVTDLSLEQMTSLGCLARTMPRDQIIMKEPAVDEIVFWEDGSMHFKDLAATAEQLQKMFGVIEP